eukprot:CAMPEP_0204269976 /NCGR_PEP_ID=MMETSP0468-20130131/17822_1 /ASSEMBLY_ACC=CAM_ASM_000383 /TAXON_ID=2969 /ORGANISM="Oxyrrhis marina" /LENGTH=62 /DNA_ID=CAMNT_0051245455 /DNA_START=61 /DNA_END=246 /DNA_ORIENTATION=+
MSDQHSSPAWRPTFAGARSPRAAVAGRRCEIQGRQGAARAGSRLSTWRTWEDPGQGGPGEPR